VSKPPQKDSGLLEYRFPGWLFATIVVVLIVGVKFLMT
jgi:hypothetical protein